MFYKHFFFISQVGVAETQGRSRKIIENSVDKASKSLQEWRSVVAKSKKHSFSCARENERLQDLARLQSLSQNQHQNNNKLTGGHHQMTEKEANKLEMRRRKAEDSARRSDTEFYTVSVRAERARLEYESTVRKGAKQFQLLEEERLSALKDLANVYLANLQALAPRLQQVLTHFCLFSLSLIGKRARRVALTIYTTTSWCTTFYKQKSYGNPFTPFSSLRCLMP